MRRCRLFVLFSLLLMISGCAGFGTPPHGHGVLTLQNQRSGERMTVQYRFPNGQLDPAGMWQASILLRDVRTNEAVSMDPRLLDFMVDIRTALRLPPQAVIVITSGYRSPQTNSELRRQSRQVAENSYHLKGQAVDIKIPGVPGSRLAQAAKSLRRGGVAYYPSSDHVHIDTGPPRSWAAF